VIGTTCRVKQPVADGGQHGPDALLGREPIEVAKLEAEAHDVLEKPPTRTSSYLTPAQWDAHRAEIRSGWGLAQETAEKEAIAKAKLAEAAQGLERVPTSSSETGFKCASSAGLPTTPSADDAATAADAAAAAAAAAAAPGGGVLTNEMLGSAAIDNLVAFATTWDGGMKKRWIVYNIHAMTRW
jgi:hypothetical protein